MIVGKLLGPCVSNGEGYSLISDGQRILTFGKKGSGLNPWQNWVRVENIGMDIWSTGRPCQVKIDGFHIEWSGKTYEVISKETMFEAVGFPMEVFSNRNEKIRERGSVSIVTRPALSLTERQFSPRWPLVFSSGAVLLWDDSLTFKEILNVENSATPSSGNT